MNYAEWTLRAARRFGVVYIPRALDTCVAWKAARSKRTWSQPAAAPAEEAGRVMLRERPVFGR